MSALHPNADIDWQPVVGSVLLGQPINNLQLFFPIAALNFPHQRKNLTVQLHREFASKAPEPQAIPEIPRSPSLGKCEISCKIPCWQGNYHGDWSDLECLASQPV